MKFQHEYRERGQHRLVLMAGHQVLAYGSWAMYVHPTFVEYNGVTWLCATDYWDGTWKPDMVYKYAEESQAEFIDLSDHPELTTTTP